MYDIIATTAHNGVITYYAVSDNEEDEILIKIKDPDKNNSSTTLTLKAAGLADVKYYLTKTSKLAIPGFSLILLPVPNNGLFFSFYIQDIFIPPPDLCAV